MGLAYFAITVSGAFYVTISILETIASIRQSQLSNLQKMQNALKRILVKESTFLAFFATVVSSWCYPNQKFHTFATDHGETNVLKRESGERPELCPQRYVL